MTSRRDEGPLLETDPRFPSGPWTGFYLQRERPGRHWMELHLTFQSGTMTGEGRDEIGEFVIRGRYQIEDGACHWSKRYVGRHDVAYQGYNEGKGIWGIWEIPPHWKGGFYIWPEEMGDPTAPHLSEAAEIEGEADPTPQTSEAEEEEPTPVGRLEPPRGLSPA